MRNATSRRCSAGCLVNLPLGIGHSAARDHGALGHLGADVAASRADIDGPRLRAPAALASALVRHRRDWPRRAGARAVRRTDFAARRWRRHGGLARSSAPSWACWARSAARYVRLVVDRVIDIQLAFPYVLLAIAITSAIRPSSIPVLILLMVLAGLGRRGAGGALDRLAGARQGLCEGRAVIGASPLRIALFHVFPSVVPSPARFWRRCRWRR